MRVLALLKRELALIFEWNKSDRLWQMPFFAALSVGIVLFIGSVMNRPNLALVSMVGTMVFLYVPDTPIFHKMILAMCVSFLMICSFSLGLLAQLYPPIIPFVVFFVTLASAQIVRYFGVGAPGFFFFTFASILGSYIPFELKDFPMAIGLVAIGTMIASLMIFLYALSVIYIFKNHITKPIPKLGELGFGAIIIDPVIIASFVAGSIVLQEFFNMEKGYWVSISCAIMLTAVTFKHVWIKQIQRILGTFLGAFLAYYLLHFTFSPFEFALLMMCLMFVAEFLVVRNYALAVIFITPSTIYLVEMASFMNYNPDMIIIARIIDISFGSMLGLIGGAFLHWQKLRKILDNLLHKIYHN